MSDKSSRDVAEVARIADEKHCPREKVQHRDTETGVRVKTCLACVRRFLEETGKSFRSLRRKLANVDGFPELFRALLVTALRGPAREILLLH